MGGGQGMRVGLCGALLLLAGCGGDDAGDGAGRGGAAASAGPAPVAGGTDGEPAPASGGAVASPSGGAPGSGGSPPGSGGGADPPSGGSGGADGLTDAGAPADGTLSSQYPGDVGLGDDTAVVWFEDFEAASPSAIAARYDQVRDNGRWTLVTDTPSGNGSALELRAGQGEEAVDFYKQLPDSDEWYVRWYARYEAGVPWHHSGMWFGGYNPAMAWPSPNAGNRPNGDDRFSIAIEPVYDSRSGDPRFDFYNYWMGMHSWMADPIDDDGTAYYGNGLVHRDDFTVDPDRWVCLEVHVVLNGDPASGAGGVLEVWKNDTLMQSFTDSGPMGYWIRDKFCPEGADGAECTDYPAPFDEVLELQYRSTTDLRLNALWPQNYITDDAVGTLGFDQIVVASRRVGCMR